MRLLLLPILLLSLMSCGIKKELATANQSNEILREKVKELGMNNAKQKENLKNCYKTNATLYKENKEFARRINVLQGEKDEFKNQDIREVSFVEAPVKKTTEHVYTKAEKMPQFPGGDSKLFAYISRNLIYPTDAKNNNIKGRIFIEFVVEKDGSITNTKVLRGIGESYDQEAMRVVKSMPKWIPGEQRGEPVRVKFVLPIYFALR